jgi:hypothetical protein
VEFIQQRIGHGYQWQRPTPPPSRTAKSGHQLQLGVDGVDVAHARSTWLCAAGSTSPATSEVDVVARVHYWKTAVIQNNGSATVFLGGSTVTATGATASIQVAANATVTVPTTGAEPVEVYAIVSSGTATVSYAYPG